MEEQIKPAAFHIGSPWIDTKCLGYKNDPDPDNKWKSAYYALVGMALGDAIGYLYENAKPMAVLNSWPENGILRDFPLNVGLGWTDDTQQSVSLIEAFMHPNHYTPRSAYEPNLRARLNCKEVMELWKVLGSRESPTGAKVEFGGFRGTGNNFRTTMLKVARGDKDPSSYTAGNGVVMKTIPLGIAAHDSELQTEQQRLSVLAENIIEVSKLMTHSLLAVTPAFATAYLAYLWTEPDDAKRWQNKKKTTVELLKDISAKTKVFESIVSKLDFFMRNKWDVNLVHCFTAILDRVTGYVEVSNIINDYDKDNAMVAIAIFVTNEIANTITDKPVLSFNDGLGITSAISAMLFALFYRDKPFLGVLQAMFYYGGDTDSVGAVLGGLLGAYAEDINVAITKVLIHEELLYRYFKKFTEHVLQKEPISWPKPKDEECNFVLIEDSVNKIIKETSKGGMPKSKSGSGSGSSWSGSGSGAGSGSGGWSGSGSGVGSGSGGWSGNGSGSGGWSGNGR